MPAFTVSAVDTTANTLTSTGVAAAGQPIGTVLQTGDRLRLRNVGGALPAATPALASATDYYAIRVSDNVIKIADTNAHALAGTGIVDLTGSGSGTTTIEFGLPYCLPTAAAGQGTLIRSVDQNQTWAALVAMWAGGYSGRPLYIPPTAFVATVNPTTWSLSGGIWTGLGPSAITWEVPFVVPAGTSVDFLEAYYARPYGGSAVSDGYSLRLKTRAVSVGAAVASATDAIVTITSGSTSSNYPNLDHTVATGTPLVTVPGSQYWLEIHIFNASAYTTPPVFLGVLAVVSHQ